MKTPRPRNQVGPNYQKGWWDKKAKKHQSFLAKLLPVIHKTHARHDWIMAGGYRFDGKAKPVDIPRPKNKILTRRELKLLRRLDSGDRLSTDQRKLLKGNHRANVRQKTIDSLSDRKLIAFSPAKSQWSLTDKGNALYRRPVTERKPELWAV